MKATRQARDSEKPFLTPLFKGGDTKPRILDREVITVGRARGCDIILDSPDVSALHCVIYRAADGYHLRDCGSRTGTHIHGEPVKNSLLRSGDILHFGPFSFQTTVPLGAGENHGWMEKGRLERCLRSRERLGKRALRLRERLKTLLASNQDLAKVELAQKTEILRDRLKTYDHRLKQLDEAEHLLSAEREQCAKEMEEQLARRHLIEEEIVQRLADADREIKERWQQFQRRCQSESIQSGVSNGGDVTLALVEETLEQQRENLLAMISSLKDLQIVIQQPRQAVDVAPLQNENTELRSRIEELETLARQPSVSAMGAEEMHELNERLEELTSENEALTQSLEQQRNALEELESKLARKLVSSDLEAYEAELNRDRQQLERERGKLTAEIESLQARNDELDEATREMEMEMSRERAELARERTRLDRLREEVRVELERIQRDATMKESLAPLQKLREQMTQKKATAPENNRLADRLKSFGNRLNEK